MAGGQADNVSAFVKHAVGVLFPMRRDGARYSMDAFRETGRQLTKMERTLGGRDSAGAGPVEKRQGCLS